MVTMYNEDVTVGGKTQKALSLVEEYVDFKDGVFEFTGEHGIFKDSYVTDNILHAVYEKWIIITPDRELLKMKINKSKDVKIVAFTQNDCNHNDSVIFCTKDN